MSTQPLNVPPQADVLTLDEAKTYITYWKDVISTLYTKAENEFIPHGFFIPFTDIMELYKLQKEVTSIELPGGKREDIYIIGVRAYFCLEEKLEVPLPITSAPLKVHGLLVAVYQKNPRVPGPDQFRHYEEERTYDLIVKVPSKREKNPDGEEETYSIYNVTRPCPSLCDYNSFMYTTGMV